MPTVVDAVIVHSSHSHASALSNPLRLFADSFSIGERSGASAPPETGAPSGGDASGGGATSASGRAREEGDSSKRRDNSGSGAASKRDDAARASSKRGDGAGSSSKRDDAACASSKRGDGSIDASSSADDVIYLGASFPRDLGRSRSASSSGAHRQSRGDGVGTSGLGGASSGIRLDRRVAHGADGRTSLQFDVFKALQRARGWCCVNHNCFLNCCFSLSVDPLTPPSPFSLTERQSRADRGGEAGSGRCSRCHHRC